MLASLFLYTGCGGEPPGADESNASRRGANCELSAIKSKSGHIIEFDFTKVKERGKIEPWQTNP